MGRELPVIERACLRVPPETELLETNFVSVDTKSPALLTEKNSETELTASVLEEKKKKQSQNTQEI